MYTIPVISIETPIGASVNIPKPGRPLCRATPSTNTLVDVPIKVHIPPKIEAYDSGISNLLAEKPASFAVLRIMGMKRATIGVLLMNAETRATDNIMAISPTA